MVLAMAITLGIVNMLVVCGNVFVFYIIVQQRSLHTATNFIVLSLTTSDFLLGTLILPFSIMQEYSKQWLFGEVWCQAWLALDVWLSTASIYNLLAISFDRYLAVRQPIKYRYVSSARMTRLTIALVWLISAMLAFPPPLYEAYLHRNLNVSVADNSTVVDDHVTVCSPMNSDSMYIVFSAFVSFILPTVLMIWMNVSIYLSVTGSRRLKNLSILYSEKAPMGKKRYPQEYLQVQRVDATGSKRQKCEAKGARSTEFLVQSNNNYASRPLHESPNVRKPPSVSMRSCSVRTSSVASDPQAISLELREGTIAQPTLRPTSCRAALGNRPQLLKPLNTAVVKPTRQNLEKRAINDDKSGSTDVDANGNVKPKVQHKSLYYPTLVLSMVPTLTSRKTERELMPTLLHMSRVNMRTEVRVARTISVVVGCFTICWLPFTIIYILQAYDLCPLGSCVRQWQFTVAFWLGYSNSAINPLIYAAFSRDFRLAFRRVLVRRESKRNRSF